jgi:hypothetical protein
MFIGPLRLSAVDNPVYVLCAFPSWLSALYPSPVYFVQNPVFLSPEYCTLSLLLCLSTKENRRKRIFGQKDHSSEKDPLKVLTNEKTGGLKVASFDRFLFKVLTMKF